MKFTIVEDSFTKTMRSTIVNHKIRTELGISCDEYVAADFIYQWRQTKKSKVATPEYVKKWTGFTLDQFKPLVLRLKELGILEKKGKTYHTTDKWDSFFSHEADFDEFWEIWKKKGNKQKSKEVYMKARATVDKETLHKAAKRKVETTTDLQYLPHASTWLNPQYKYWEDVIPLKNQEQVKQDGNFDETTD